jgi:hypothetical protein
MRARVQAEFDGPMANLRTLFQPRALTSGHIRVAYAIALATDALQIALGPFGWAFADEILDVVAGLALSRVIGFHPLLLPTFVLELIPVADLLPTWTGCVAVVIALRRRFRVAESSRPQGDVIDV